MRLIARLQTGSATVAPTAVSVIDLPNTALTGVAAHTVTLILALSRYLLFVAREPAAHRWINGNDQRVGAREFSLMKSTASFVITARARMAHEDALVEVLDRIRESVARMEQVITTKRRVLA